MSEADKTTLKKIMDAGKAEFLEKGFLGASLRNIAKCANVTTGAFYGYFKSKEELFETLVGEYAEKAMEMFIKAQDDFANLPPDEQPSEMGKISSDCMEEIVEYMYSHFDEFKLILFRSEGTRFAGFIDKMVEIEVEGTFKFIEVLKSQNRHVKEVSAEFIHIIASGMFTAYFEFIDHDMPKKEAKAYVADLKTFYMEGWRSVMDFD